MRVFLRIALLAYPAAICAWSQTAADTALRPLVGQPFLLPHIGDQAKTKLKKSQLSRINGSCDVAVLVKDASWKQGTVRFKLEHIGTASVVNRPRGACPNAYDEIVLEVSGFGLDEAADSLLNSIRQVLQTPEEYLRDKGIQFTLQPAMDDEAPAKPPPAIVQPKPLLLVDGAYTAAARSSRVKGSVQLRLVVGSDGRAHRLKVVSGLGAGLDESALRVLPLWRFEPATQSGKPVAFQSTIEMNFNIL